MDRGMLKKYKYGAILAGVATFLFAFVYGKGNWLSFLLVFVCLYCVFMYYYKEHQINKVISTEDYEKEKLPIKLTTINKLRFLWGG
ncbi:MULTISPECIES: hypothetical protein [Paenibacillus]|uniref:hypothetical protein n=1 Tax=Paenibacillus TaxID=44249 RepID=UPI0030D881D8